MGWYQILAECEVKNGVFTVTFHTSSYPAESHVVYVLAFDGKIFFEALFKLRIKIFFLSLLFLSSYKDIPATALLALNIF